MAQSTQKQVREEVRGAKVTLEGDGSMFGDWLVVRSRGRETLGRH